MSISAHEPVSVTLSTLPSGGLAVAVNTDGCTPVHAWLDNNALAPLRDVAALATPAAVLIPGLDQEVIEAEAAWGRAAAQALFADPAIAVGFARALGECSRDGVPPPVVLSVAEGAGDQLPWELLYDSACSESLELAGQGVVVRLVPRARRPRAVTKATRLRSLLWAPDAAEPAVARLVDAARGRVECATDLLQLPPALDRLPERRADTAEVLHIICHGERDLDTLTLMLSDQKSTSAGTTAALLQPLLDRCGLVLLDVCHGGMVQAGVLGGLGRRLVAAGAPAVVTTGTAVGVDAAAAFAEGCLGTLKAGEPLHSAVLEGRRRVAAIALGHPEVRWHNHRLLVGHSRVAGAPVVLPPGWRPPGIPRACPEADALWESIRGYTDAMGFMGTEAVLLGLLGAALPSRLAAQVAYQVGHRRPDLERRVAALRSPPVVQSPLPVTPRLRRLAKRLPPSMSLVTLVGMLCDACESPERLAAVSSLGAHNHCDRLKIEVVGGPEDGRTLQLRERDVLGRWSPTPPQRCSHPLYVEQPTFDPALSRSGVLEVVGPARVRALRAAVWHVPAMELASQQPGESDTLGFMETDRLPERRRRGEAFPLHSGDIVWLSVVAAPDSPVGVRPVSALRVVATPNG